MRVQGGLLLVFFCFFICGLKAGKSYEYHSSPDAFAVLKSGKHWYIWRNDSMIPFQADFDSIYVPYVRGNRTQIIQKSKVFRWKRLGADSVSHHYKKRHVTFLIFARSVNLIVRKNNLYGLLNRYGSVLNGYQFDEIGAFDYYAKVKKNGKYGLLSMHGYASEIKYSRIPYSESYQNTFCVKGENGWGYLRFIGYPGCLENKELCPLIYDSITGFWSNNLSKVMKDGKWGVMNDSGLLVMPLIYDRIEFVGKYPGAIEYDGDGPELSGNKFLVWRTKGGREYLVNRKGEEIKDNDPDE